MQLLKIGFEGIHRSGKGTQMKLLQDHLRKDLTRVISIRGEYYRKGNDTQEPFDPYSTRRQKNWNDDTLNHEKSERINREIRVFFDRYLSDKVQEGSREEEKTAVLFDRTIISRHFLNSVSGKELPFEELKYITTKTGKRIEKVIPELIFAFQCNRDVLLERLNYEKLTDDNRAYKQSIIEQYANKFNNYLGYKLPDELRANTITIDATKTPDILHDEIKEHLDSYLMRRGKH